MNSLHDLRSRIAARNTVCYVEAVGHGIRKVPLSRGKHTRGWHPVRTGHAQIQFESKLECRAITMISRHPELISIESQPLTVQYRCGDGRYRYTPDLCVQLEKVPDAMSAVGFEKRTYVEVKPLKRAMQQEAELCRKFSAIRAATGCPIILLTEWDLLWDGQEDFHAS